MIRHRLLLICTLMLVQSACSPAATTAYTGERADINQAIQAATLGPGDSVAVRVYLHKDLDGNYVIAPTGSITFPLLGEIHCEGLTPDGLGKLIAARLAAGYIRNPQVIVSIDKLNSKNVYVLGKVSKPGKFVFADRMTIIDAITLAGGFAALAEKNYTIVTRNDRRIPLPVEKIMQGLARNFFLEPGDIVFVPQSIM